MHTTTNIDKDSPLDADHSDDNTNDNNDIPLLSLSDFASLHLQHILSHPPDSVLFPFLHGLEGENHAQNTFFSSQASSTLPLASSVKNSSRPIAKVPKYRGLVWVVAEDDLEAEPHKYARELSVLRRKKDGGFGDLLSSPSPSSSPPITATTIATATTSTLNTPMLGSSDSCTSSDFDEDEDEDDDDDDDDYEMDYDEEEDDQQNIPVHVGYGRDHRDSGVVTLSVGGAVDVVQPDDAMDVDGHREHEIPITLVPQSVSALKEADEEKHMHPVVQRPTPIQTINLSSSYPSTISSGLSSSITTASSESSPSSPLSSSCSPASVPPASPHSAMGESATIIPKPVATNSHEPTPTPSRTTSCKSLTVSQPLNPQALTDSTTPSQSHLPDLSLLTCTFRPHEILRPLHPRFRPRINLNADLDDVDPRSRTTSPEDIAEEKSDSINGKSWLSEVGKRDGKWEFVPAVVPNGISLRNFGIQVPIYATLSDIVVYSPEGPTQNARVLARRLQQAVRRKWEERVEKLGGLPEGSDPNQHPELLNYNVYLLDSTAEDMHSPSHGGVPHLVMRVCGNGVPGAPTERKPAAASSDHPQSLNGNETIQVPTQTVSQTHSGNTGAHTNGTDGHLVDMDSTTVVEGAGRSDGMSVDPIQSPGEADTKVTTTTTAGCASMEIDVSNSNRADSEKKTVPAVALATMTTTTTQSSTASPHDPNTVDFAQREKEEMRDLTKASEIIRLLPPPGATTGRSTSGDDAVDDGDDVRKDTMSPKNWIPLAGQVFLGNPDDVPLAPDVPKRFRPSGTGVAAGAGISTDTVGREEGPSNIRRKNKQDMEELEREGSDEEDEDETEAEPDPEDPFNYRPTNDPLNGYGYDICIECHDMAPFPTTAHLRAAEEHLTMLDSLWARRVAGRREKESKRKRKQTINMANHGEDQQQHAPSTDPADIPSRPPPNANAVIHLPFPSSPTNTQTSMNFLMPVVRFLEKWLTPITPPPPPPSPPPLSPPLQSRAAPLPPTGGNASQATSSMARRWSSVSSLMPHFPFPGSSSSSSSSTSTSTPSPLAPQQSSLPFRIRSFTYSQPPQEQKPSPSPTPTPSPPPRTRPIKVLIYSADGYTESSVPALCLLMAVKRLLLPEAYLELQVARRRSFFVYHTDLGVLRRVESRLREDAERERERLERDKLERERGRMRSEEPQGGNGGREIEIEGINVNGKRIAPSAPTRSGSWGNVMGNGWRISQRTAQQDSATPAQQQQPQPQPIMGRPAAKSVSFAQPPVRSPSMAVPSPVQAQGMNHHRFTTDIAKPSAAMTTVKGRPRANTSPWLPSLFGDHQSWFNDPRFDGSFPSRVLPFLYLGNLNHAANAYMLHALGITHVVSVGECALIPPPHHTLGQGSYYASSPYQNAGTGTHYVPGKGPGQGSLWFEEREGRIKVLDIKGVCDDGIDTLEPQLEPICDWIDQARMEGGQVLVHCRVGVSRSATVTIAYVMKHLGLPLVDAYLIVRSRRLSVLIQPNMRLLYNLCGWEIKLAKARAGGDEDRLRAELAKTLSWPYLAKEVHALNEKYLH